MEIKKGISQMPEYPNKEIDYVVPSDGKMYYVLSDGALDNGVVVATLDPKRAIDEAIDTSTLGAFKDDGTILIDFDKKMIKRITDDLLLVVESKITAPEVLDAISHQNDAIFMTSINDNKSIIIDKLDNEMGITGELLFSDPLSQANVYRMDSYNNKVGIDCSFIGKTSKELYFHTNKVDSKSSIIKLDNGVLQEKTISTENKDNTLPQENDTTENKIDATTVEKEVDENKDNTLPQEQTVSTENEITATPVENNLEENKIILFHKKMI